MPRILSFFLFQFVLSVVAGIAIPDAKVVVPGTVVIDGQRLVDVKERTRRKDPACDAELKHLVAQADYWLTQGPWSVTTKTEAPPNGTLHDYASQAPYWWPSNTTNGCPYINIDGVVNPEVNKYPDHLNRGLMFNSSYILSLAWYYTGHDQYAKHAGDILRTWFLNPSTKMNPNLEHAQIIPCKNSGRSIGIIDFSQEYTDVIDAAAILNTGAPGWTSDDVKGFKTWNSQFLTWLSQSDFGMEEANATNNHGTWANMQIAALALFTGNHSLALSTTKLATNFINGQILKNGTQPQEVVRTRSFHYSNFNLAALLRWAMIAEKLGINLYKYKGPQGQTLFAAVDAIIPAAVNGQKDWPFEELEFLRYAATDNVHAAANAGYAPARKVVRKLQPPPGGDIFRLRPAPEQLDNIDVTS